MYDQHQRRGDEDREGDRPAEHQVDDQRQREQVDAGDQHGRDGERAGVEGVGGLVEAQPQVLGDRADLGPVVERHHHQPQEDHRRDRAEPVVVDGGDPVLGAVGGLAEDLERAEVGGDERQPGDPGRQRAAGEEEVEVGLDRQPGDEPDAQHDHEVDPQDHVVDRARMEPQHPDLPLLSTPGCLTRRSARSAPSPSIAILTRSPEPRNRGGSSAWPTPLGVPVRIRSPGAQRARLGDELDQLRAAEDQVRGAAVLAQLVVDPGAQPQVAGVGHLVGGRHPRAERAEGVGALGARPLRLSPWRSRALTSSAMQ